eukprot:3870092-Pyramimonas_sp.AAC.1
MPRLDLVKVHRALLRMRPSCVRGLGRNCLRGPAPEQHFSHPSLHGRNSLISCIHCASQSD